MAYFSTKISAFALQTELLDGGTHDRDKFSVPDKSGISMLRAGVAFIPILFVKKVSFIKGKHACFY